MINRCDNVSSYANLIVSKKLLFLLLLLLLYHFLPCHGCVGGYIKDLAARCFVGWERGCASVSVRTTTVVHQIDKFAVLFFGAGYSGCSLDTSFILSESAVGLQLPNSKSSVISSLKPFRDGTLDMVCG